MTEKLPNQNLIQNVTPKFRRATSGPQWRTVGVILPRPLQPKFQTANVYRYQIYWLDPKVTHGTGGPPARLIAIVRDCSYPLYVREHFHVTAINELQVRELEHTMPRCRQSVCVLLDVST